MGLIPDEGTRSHMPQLSVSHAAKLQVHMPQLKDPTCHNDYKRSCMSQLRHDAAK